MCQVLLWARTISGIFFKGRRAVAFIRFLKKSPILKKKVITAQQGLFIGEKVGNVQDGDFVPKKNGPPCE